MLLSLHFGRWGYQCLAIFSAFPLRFRITHLIGLILHWGVYIYLLSYILSAIRFVCRLTLKIRNSRRHWYNYCSIRSIWCWVKPCAGITFLPPEIRVTTPGSLKAECPVTDSNGFSLLVLHPLLKIMPYFRLLQVWIMTLLWRILFFALSSSLEFLVAFLFSFLLLSAFFISSFFSYHLFCWAPPSFLFSFFILSGRSLFLNQTVLLPLHTCSLEIFLGSPLLLSWVGTS